MEYHVNNLANDKVTLYNLTVKDAAFFYKVYSHPALTVNFDESPFLPDETPEQFTKRIISLCEFIFTIRPADNPSQIIGDCALHHWDKQNKSIEIGGSLLPEYWGKGYMKAAFELLIGIAKQELEATAVYGRTRTKNFKAIRFAEKMGFAGYQTDEQDTILRKEILEWKL